MSDAPDFEIDLTASGIAEHESQLTERENKLRRTYGYKRALIQPSDVLGTGSYGIVVKARLDDLPCAAKILHHAFFTSYDPHVQNFIRRFKQECRILRHLRHPCIVQFLGVLEDPRPRSNHRPILLMELMEDSLTHYLESRQRALPYHIQVNITYDIALALVYLHANGVQHRDLSSNNILLTAGTGAKLTDFGMSKMVDLNPRMTRNIKSQTKCPGTLAYMPPEALRIEPVYSDKIDVFSTGVLIVQIITRQFPKPTDAHNPVNDPNYEDPILVPVPELERRKNDLQPLFMTHPLGSVALDCIKDKERERPKAADLCRLLVQLKASPEYANSLSQYNEQVQAIPPTKLPIALECIKDKEAERPKATHLCQQLATLKVSPEYGNSLSQYNEQVQAIPPTKCAVEMRDTEIAVLDGQIESLTQERNRSRGLFFRKKDTRKIDADITDLQQKRKPLIEEKESEEAEEQRRAEFDTVNTQLKERVQKLETENASILSELRKYIERLEKEKKKSMSEQEELHEKIAELKQIVHTYLQQKDVKEEEGKSGDDLPLAEHYKLKVSHNIIFYIAKLYLSPFYWQRSRSLPSLKLAPTTGIYIVYAVCKVIVDHMCMHTCLCYVEDDAAQERMLGAKVVRLNLSELYQHLNAGSILQQMVEAKLIQPGKKKDAEAYGSKYAQNLSVSLTLLSKESLPTAVLDLCNLLDTSETLQQRNLAIKLREGIVPLRYCIIHHHSVSCV